MNTKDAVKTLYTGTTIFGGAIAGLWAFTANRFQVSESLMIVAGGMIAGFGLGLACYAMCTLLKR